MMNLERLERVIIDTIMEDQIKLGYEKETIRLYYPMASLESLLQLDKTGDVERLLVVLHEFCSFVKDRLGEIAISHKGNRFCLGIPAVGVEYVHNHVEMNSFWKELIDLIGSHTESMEDILALFRKYYANVVCLNSSIPDFDYVIFDDSQTENCYYYCFKQEGVHITYHRFLKEDYDALGVY